LPGAFHEFDSAGCELAYVRTLSNKPHKIEAFDLNSKCHKRNAEEWLRSHLQHMLEIQCNAGFSDEVPFQPFEISQLMQKLAKASHDFWTIDASLWTWK